MCLLLTNRKSICTRKFQRRLVEILRGVRPDIVLATHSVEILGEADAGEILLVDKFQQSARRLRDVDGVQQALEKIRFNPEHNID